MAPPSIPSFSDGFETESHSPNLMLSPFPPFSNCCSHSLFSDHDYVCKQNENTMKIESANGMSVDCFDLLPQNKLLTSCDEEVSDGDSKVDIEDNLVNDVTLVKGTIQQESSDADFLHELDDLDFDLIGLEASRGSSLENDFQSFIESTIDAHEHFLQETCFVPSCEEEENDINDNEEQEDVYKKEFFMKHLRLQRSPQKYNKNTPSLSGRINRKRKYGQINNDNKTVHDSTFSSVQNITQFSSNISSHISKLGDFSHNNLGSFNKYVSNCNQNCCHSQSTSVSHNSIHSCSHLNNINNSRTTTTHSTSSSITTLPPSSQSSYHSVPSKLCSNAIVDWQRAVLYSTAKSSQSVSCQTSPSTAATPGNRPHVKSNSMPSDLNSIFNHSNNSRDCLAPSLPLSVGIGSDCFQFQLVDGIQMEEDAEDLLQWLDNQQQTKTLSFSHSHDKNTLIDELQMRQNDLCNNNIDDNDKTNHRVSESSSVSFSISGSEIDRKSNEFDLDVILSPEQNSSTSPSWEMETFMDLEAYVTDEPSSNGPSDCGVSKPQSCHISNSDLKSNNAIFPKKQIRLSLLTDIVNKEYNEKKDAIKRDILRSCCDNYDENDNVMDSSSCWDEDESSSLLSSPTSSTPSSPLSPEHLSDFDNKNLHMLDMFADENVAWCF